MGKTGRRLGQAVLVVLILGLGAIGLVVLTMSKPELTKKKPVVEPPAVMTARVGLEASVVMIQGQGVVKPVREINLAPQVSGKVVEISPSLVNGGEFSQGDVLFSINPEDYKLALATALARVRDAESALKLAREESEMSKEEWRVHRSSTKRIPPLVAKEPQLAAARARLEAERAELRRAQLNLDRTKVVAPFDGVVSSKSVDIGQYVSPGQTVAALFSSEAVEVVVPLEDKDLFWLDVPGFTTEGGPGSPAVVKAFFAGRNLSWPAGVVRAQGKLDERTRMVNVVVRVEKPYAQKPPLAVGLFVTVEISGHELEKIAVIPRPALHEGDIVWVIEPDKEDYRIKFRRVETARLQEETVLIRSGLKQGEFVVTTRISAVTDGMKVRIVPEQKSGQSP